MTPRVSIIVPCYNVKEFISNCIESIMSQEMSDFELLLVDDGSTDGTADICDEYAEANSNIRVIHQQNKGASAARNAGLEIASGEWIAFIDSDDWVDTDFLSIIDFDPNSDMIFFGFKEVRKTETLTKPITFDIGDCSDRIDYVLSKLFTSKETFFGYTVNKFYRRSIIEAYGLRFNESLVIKEDEEFITRYCRYIKSLAISPKIPYNYRILTSSISHRGLKNKRLLQLVQALERDLIDYPHNQLKKALLNAAYRYHLMAIRENRHDGDIRESVRLFDEFYARNKEMLHSNNKCISIFKFPIKSVRLKLLSIIPYNPIFKFFTLYYWKCNVYKITSRFIK